MGITDVDIPCHTKIIHEPISGYFRLFRMFFFNSSMFCYRVRRVVCRILSYHILSYHILFRRVLFGRMLFGRMLFIYYARLRCRSRLGFGASVLAYFVHYRIQFHLVVCVQRALYLSFLNSLVTFCFELFKLFVLSLKLRSDIAPTIAGFLCYLARTHIDECLLSVSKTACIEATLIYIVYRAIFRTLTIGCHYVFAPSTFEHCVAT